MVYTTMDITYVPHYYDYERGWEGTNPGWYQAIARVENMDEHLVIVEWLHKNIDNPERHCRWTRTLNESIVKFRYERDYIHFRLRW
jgi:hypothetical protein